MAKNFFCSEKKKNRKLKKAKKKKLNWRKQLYYFWQQFLNLGLFIMDICPFVLGSFECA